MPGWPRQSPSTGVPLGAGGVGIGGTVEHGAVQLDDARHFDQLRRQAQHADAGIGNFLMVRQQHLAAVGHGLDAVDGKKGLVLAGIHGQAVLVV